jgi:hypothetical protein
MSTEGRMASNFGRFTRGFASFFLAFSLVASCSDTGTEPKKELAPLVGVWDAQVLSVPNPDDPSQTIDLVQEGASYALSVLSTGQYTAVFDLIVLQGHEAGTIEISGDGITMTPTIPPGSVMSGDWMFQGDTLIVDAFRELDYDGDGEEELVFLHFELIARES